MRTISLTVSPDTATGVLIPFDGNFPYPSTRDGNRLQWTLAETGGARLIVGAPNHQTIEAYGNLPVGSNELPWSLIQGEEYARPMDLEALAPVLAQPTIRGRQFLLNGQPWPWAMMTGFCDYALLLRGQQAQLEDVLGETQVLGAHGRRILLQMHYITHFYPQEFGSDFYARLPELIALENKYGQVPEIVLYADEQVIRSGRTHFDQSANALRGLANFTELANEFSKNGINPLEFPQYVPGLVFSRGSDTSEAPIVQPPGNYATFRERRDLWKCIGRGYKADEACWDFGFEVPFVCNEPIGANEVEQPGRRSANPALFVALAAQYKAVGAYSTFHCEAGLTSASLGPVQRDCAKAYFAILNG